jgi:predicted NAD/FAD-binding protein
MNETQDVAIVGAGAAGLSAALVLGRCRRSVSLFDADDREIARRAPCTACSDKRARRRLSCWLKADPNLHDIRP